MPSFSSVTKKLAALIAGLALLATTACANIPQSSSIRYRGNVLSNAASDYLYYSPAGPAKGMTQSEILAGFINAATGPQNDYAVARQYLSTGAKSEWAPNDQVLIQQGVATTTFPLENIASVELGVQASVDGAGRYQIQPQGTKRVLQFNFVKQNGEWRISKAPNLTVLLRPVFDVIFHSYSVYFWSSNHDALVPDLRWFPERASTATRLVTALLDGPSPWLSITSSDAPNGTELAIDSVPVADGVAQVNLNQNFLASQQSGRRFFYTQLRETLLQVGGVDDVQILVQDSPQDIQPVEVGSSASGESDAPLILSSSALRALEGPTSTSLSDAKNFLSTLKANDFAVSSDERVLAVQNAAGTWRANLGSISSTARLVDARLRQVAPAFDSQNLLWTHTKLGDDPFFVITQAGSVNTLSTPWLAGLRVRGFALSPEGARVAILAGSGGQYRIYLSAIQRDPSGAPVRLHAPKLLADRTGSPISVAWGSSNQVVALFEQPDGLNSVPVSFIIGGDFSELVPAADARSVLASSRGAVFVLTKDGSLLVSSGFSWSTKATSVVAAHFVH